MLRPNPGGHDLPIRFGLNGAESRVARGKLSLVNIPRGQRTPRLRSSHPRRRTMREHLAPRSDKCVLLNLDERADPRAFPHRAPVEIDERSMPKIYVLSEANGVRYGHWLRVDVVGDQASRRGPAKRGAFVGDQAISSARKHRTGSIVTFQARCEQGPLLKNRTLTVGRPQTSVTRTNISHAGVAHGSDCRQKSKNISVSFAPCRSRVRIQA